MRKLIAIALSFFLVGQSWAGSRRFDGTDDYASFGTGNFLTGDFTLAMWLNATSWPTLTGQYYGIFCKRSSFVTMSFELYYNNPIDAPSEGLTFGFGNSLAANIGFAVKPTTSVWNHIALTRSGNDFVLYLNGVSAATASNATAVPTGTDTVVAAVLGSELVGLGPYHLSGSLQDLRIFTRALTADEVKTMMLCMNYPMGASSAWYFLEPEASPTFADSSGNGVSGTNSGANPSTDGPPNSWCTEN